MTQQWKATDASALAWRVWDDGHVVYDDASGDTHRLDPLSAEILQHLCATGASRQELKAHLADLLGHGPDESLGKRLDATLAKFKRLGLVESVDL